MTRTRVKICCIASREEATLALAAGASALGLVSAMPSGPGPIAEAVIADIVAALAPGVDSFLLTSLLDADTIAAQHARCPTRSLQLVDRLHAGELPRLRRRLPETRLVQVVHVEDDSALDEARAAAPYVDALLLDSGRLGGTVKELGGTGRVHDWRISRRIRQALPEVRLWLAGGLNEGNVALAIRAVQPWGVDICSSVRSQGALDAGKLRDFFTAIHGAESDCRESPPV